MKVKEVRKIQIHGIKEQKDEDEEETDQPNANGVITTKKARDYNKLRNQVKDAMMDSETREIIINEMHKLKKKIKLQKFLDSKYGVNADLTGLDIDSIDLNGKVKANIKFADNFQKP